MKKIFVILTVALGILSTTSCSDLLEAESSRQNIEPYAGEKTDSVFYAYGILQAMQQLADQYVFQGEMRGDLVKTTAYTDNNLRQLANFSATTANKYDSAYVYYRVINNCNYFIAHSDTALYTGSTNVVIDKYVAAKAIRAWAYLQLGRNYGRVPFFTEPLTKISQIDNGGFPELDLAGIVAELAPDLEQYSGMQPPRFLRYTETQATLFSVGSPNWEGTAKSISPYNLFVPVDVVLGDLYLETQQFARAASHFITYLTKVGTSAFISPTRYGATLMSKSLSTGRFGQVADEDIPNQNDRNPDPAMMSWSSIFSRNSLDDIITYIPMAVNRQNGQTTDVPLAFGFNYYATSEENERIGNLREPYVEEIQIQPSDALNLLSDSTEYYYYVRLSGQTQATLYDSIRVAKCGDMRLRNVITQVMVEDTAVQWIDKYKYANIILYRNSTVLLHLAEAFNRLGMPDAAFAILKDGLSENLISRNNADVYYCQYLSDETRQALQTTYPVLSAENINLFPVASSCGIHSHGAGKAAGDCATTNYLTGKSPYTYDRMTGLKMDELAKQFGITIGTTKQDTINAVEDLLCDEYALELAFEGNRFYDLCRLARHKNAAGLYGSNFGGQWLARKLDYKHPQKDLTIEANWYLPFK